MEQLSGLDACFVYADSDAAPMHLGALALYDPSTAPQGRVSFDDYRVHVDERLHLARCFRRRLVRVPFDADHPYWVEDATFELENHIAHDALPRPGSWEQLRAAVAHFFAQPLDPDRPLWELVFIEGLDAIPGLPEGSFAVASKVHHSAIDGVSGSELLTALHDAHPQAAPAEPDQRWRPEHAPDSLTLLSRSALHGLGLPLRLTRALGISIPVALRASPLLSDPALPSVGLAPRTRFNASVTPKRVLAMRSFDLRFLREIKKSVVGATLNDVVLALCGGALRKYLIAKDELPEEPLVAIAPLSIRGGGDEPGGNRFSQMRLSLCTDIEDPAERLREIHRVSFHAKEFAQAIGAPMLSDYTDLIPDSLLRVGMGVVQRMGLVPRFNRVCNTVVTNIPGPTIPIYSAGARLESIHGMGPLVDGVGLFHTAFSYRGQLTITVLACPELMPDPERYAAYLEESYEELEGAILGLEPLAWAGRRVARRAARRWKRRPGARSAYPLDQLLPR